jgi:hypothetical protein
MKTGVTEKIGTRVFKKNLQTFSAADVLMGQWIKKVFRAIDHP